MKETFKEYNPIEIETIKNLWDNALFIFDTNILLNLYRYSEETSEKFIETILKLKARIWLPYQVGFEFHKNRLNVISEQKKNYQEFEKKFKELIIEIDNKNRNPFVSKNLLSDLKNIDLKLKKEIEDKIEVYDKSLIKDELLNKINNAFEKKVGEKHTIEEMKNIFQEGEKRYKEKIPPGFSDIKKQESERFGDLIIWKEILKKAKNDSLDIILILDDRKEDWWLDHQGKTISPRPELLNEFYFETKKKCHFYKPFQFLEYSNKYLGSKINDEIIEEVKNYELNIKEEFIQISLTLNGKQSDVMILTDQLKLAGYKVFYKNLSEDGYHQINLILPDIPDLERRLNSKYLSNLNIYNVTLIKKDRF